MWWPASRVLAGPTNTGQFACVATPPSGKVLGPEQAKCIWMGQLKLALLLPPDSLSPFPGLFVRAFSSPLVGSSFTFIPIFAFDLWFFSTLLCHRPFTCQPVNCVQFLKRNLQAPIADLLHSPKSIQWACFLHFLFFNRLIITQQNERTHLWCGFLLVNNHMLSICFRRKITRILFNKYGPSTVLDSRPTNRHLALRWLSLLNLDQINLKDEITVRRSQTRMKLELKINVKFILWSLWVQKHDNFQLLLLTDCHLKLG